MKTITVKQLREKLAGLGGALKSGKHNASSGECCALELVCAVRKCSDDGADLSDDPKVVGMPDFRNINDSAWESDAQRTKHMLPVLAAYSDFMEWSEARQVATVNEYGFLYVHEILPIALRIWKLEKEAETCEGVKDKAAARIAA